MLISFGVCFIEKCGFFYTFFVILDLQSAVDSKICNDVNELFTSKSFTRRFSVLIFSICENFL